MPLYIIETYISGLGNDGDNQLIVKANTPELAKEFVQTVLNKENSTGRSRRSLKQEIFSVSLININIDNDAPNGIVETHMY